MCVVACYYNFMTVPELEEFRFTWCHGCFLFPDMIYTYLYSQVAKWSAFMILAHCSFPGAELRFLVSCLAGLPVPISWEIVVCWGYYCEEPEEQRCQSRRSLETSPLPSWTSCLEASPGDLLITPPAGH